MHKPAKDDKFISLLNNELFVCFLFVVIVVSKCKFLLFTKYFISIFGVFGENNACLLDIIRNFNRIPIK